MLDKSIKIGLYGKGKWSQILQQKLKGVDANCKVSFIADSSDPRLNSTDLNEIEWAFISSSNETHYEIVESCLRAGVNVFCEKPLSASEYEVSQLYDLAEEMGICLYVDDVFIWRNEFKQIDKTEHLPMSATWGKNDSIHLTGLRLAQDLAYHHIYMLGELYNLPEFSCSTEKSATEFKINLVLSEDISINLSYSKCSKSNTHQFLGTDLARSSNDALLDMIGYVLRLTKVSNRNKNLTLWTTRVLKAVISYDPEKVAIIGGGIFGCTSALELSKNGYSVTIYESNSDIIMGATMKNQLRVHRGYHYPRSDETARQCYISEYKFKAYFRSSMEDSNVHYYAIASQDSRVSPDEYELFMNRNNLPYTVVDNQTIKNVLNLEMISKIYAVEEASYNPEKLRSYLKERCIAEGVRFVFNEQIEKIEDLGHDYDQYVIATYSHPLLDSKQVTQYEVCEKPLIRLPDRFKNLSLVIMDGPFVSLDPYSPNPSLHLIGSVEDAIHSRNTGYTAEVPESLKSYLTQGLIENPSITHIDKFKKRFTSLYNLSEDEITHVGSFFMIRAVEAYHDDDDRRLSVLNEPSENIHNIFSAKVTSAPLISQSLLRRVEEVSLRKLLRKTSSVPTMSR